MVIQTTQVILSALKHLIHRQQTFWICQMLCTYMTITIFNWLTYQALIMVRSVYHFNFVTLMSECTIWIVNNATLVIIQ